MSIHTDSIHAAEGNDPRSMLPEELSALFGAMGEKAFRAGQLFSWLHEKLADDYEYAYWLGYIYRCECHMHDESSRMVYGAFNEKFMWDFYQQLTLDDDTALIDCAPEICRRLDVLLVGKLWR